MENILEISKLCMHFPVRGGVFGQRIGTIKAVDEVSLSIAPGETLGTVKFSIWGTSMFIRIIEKDTPSGSEPKIRMIEVMRPQPIPKIILPFLLRGDVE